MPRRRSDLPFPDTIPAEHMPWSEKIEHLMSLAHLLEDDATSRPHPDALEALLPYLRSFAARRAPASFAQTLDAFCRHVHRLTLTAPTRTELLVAPSIDRWCAILDADETVLLIGLVHGHPLLREGARARTAPLIRLAPRRGWARTWSRHYRLGTPDPGFFLELQRDDRLPAQAEIDWKIMAPLSRH